VVFCYTQVFPWYVSTLNKDVGRHLPRIPDSFLVPSGQFTPLPHRPVVRFSSCVPSYKQFLPKNRGLRRSWEGAELLIPQLAALVLVINNFLLPPVLFIEKTLYPLYLETVQYTVV
jgi:hypothetical protein